MAKEKKIRVVFFPQKFKREEGRYNTYCRVLYNRKATMFAINQTFDASSKEEAQRIIDFELENYPERKPNLLWRKAWIEQLIKAEIERFGEEYSVTGFGKRAEFYISNLAMNLTYDLYGKLFEKLKDNLTYNNYLFFKKKVDDEQEIYAYFKIFDIFKILKADYGIDLKKLVDEDFLTFISVLGFYQSFTYDEAIDLENKITEETGNVTTRVNLKTGEVQEWKLKDRVPPRSWIMGGFDVGSWILNEYDVKVSFQDYLNLKRGYESIEEYSEKGYSWLVNQIDKSYRFDSDNSLKMIDGLVENKIGNMMG